ncbi:hypothetical protein ACJ73_04287 [Blastomyces percursus]|uniref:Single-strand DNA deaminase toxin A-like C-terminal domain-containing protein n=1 Tax=Blastomyces percursus TaxID=1658174 RepID=A0A1J9Q7A0_9EURO|nr:hypothetical protein ACJ73_04287 [Blastomyces percursus]
MSGWGHEQPETFIITGKRWTKQVFAISSAVQHALKPNEYDQGLPGQFNASHAEKQLIAYFIEKHVFLGDEREPNSNWDRSLYSLFESRPPVALTKATILVNRAPCDDCRAFIQRIKLVLNIEFQIIFC